MALQKEETRIYVFLMANATSLGFQGGGGEDLNDDERLFPFHRFGAQLGRHLIDAFRDRRSISVSPLTLRSDFPQAGLEPSSTWIRGCPAVAHHT